jgi:hypothetical protein
LVGLLKSQVKTQTTNPYSTLLNLLVLLFASPRRYGNRHGCTTDVLSRYVEIAVAWNVDAFVVFLFRQLV